MAEVHLYAGPSLAGGAASGVVVRGPAARGDVARLIEERAPGVLAIADGLIDRHLAVSHRELVAAIDRGWKVWGLSALGAVRAYELRREGMRGYGRVYRGFHRRADLRDDEVVHLHAAAPPYRAASEPLVHLREALGWLRRRQAIGPDHARAVLADLRERWFGERTREAFCAALRGCRPPVPAAVIGAMLDRFGRFELQKRDLGRFLKARPWADGDA